MGGKLGISARIAAAAIFALAASAMLPANNAMAQAPTGTGPGVAGSLYILTDNDDATLSQGSTASFNVDISGYTNNSAPRWLGANVIMTTTAGHDLTPVDANGGEVVDSNDVRRLETDDFFISIERANASIFLVTEGISGGGTFQVVIPGTVYIGPNAATVPVDIIAKASAALGDVTFTAGDARRFRIPVAGVPPAEDAGTVRARRSSPTSDVTYTVVPVAATLATVGSTNIPAVAGTERTFSVTLANIPSTVTATDDVQRVRLVLEFAGADLNTGNFTVYNTGAGDACTNASCGWESGEYRITFDAGATPADYSYVSTSDNGQGFMDVPIGILTDGGATIPFTLTTKTEPDQDAIDNDVITVKLARFGLRADSDTGANLREIFNDSTNADRQQTVTYDVDDAPSLDNARLDPTISTIGGVPITLVEATGVGDGDSTGTVPIDGSTVADSRTAEVEVSALAPGTIVTSITATRGTANVDVGGLSGTAPGPFTAQLRGLVPGVYSVRINTRAANTPTPAERTYTITLTVSGASIARAGSDDLAEDGTAGEFTVSLAGIDTGDSVDGVSVTLEFNRTSPGPVAQGDLTDFGVDSGRTWLNNLFALTFPAVVDAAEILHPGGTADRITFTANLPGDGSGTVEVPIGIEARSGNAALRGDYVVSIVSATRAVSGTPLATGGTVTPRPSAAEAFTVVRGTSPALELTAPDTVAREADTSDTGRFRIALANLADSSQSVLIPYTLTGSATLTDDYTVALSTGAFFTNSGNAASPRVLNDTITVNASAINGGNATITMTVTAVDDRVREATGRETIILTLTPPSGLNLEAASGLQITIADGGIGAADGSTHDFTDVCDRTGTATTGVQGAIITAIGGSPACDTIIASDIEDIGSGNANYNLTITDLGGTLALGDLDDLDEVNRLNIEGNALTGLPDNIFRDMGTFERLRAGNNPFSGDFNRAVFSDLASNNFTRMAFSSGDFADNALDDVLLGLQRVTLPSGLKRFANFDGATSMVVPGETAVIPIELRTAIAGATDGDLPVAVMIPVTVTAAVGVTPAGTVSVTGSVEEGGGNVLTNPDSSAIAGVVIPAGAERAFLRITATADATGNRVLTIGEPVVGVIDTAAATFTASTHEDGVSGEPTVDGNIVHASFVDEGTAQATVPLEVGLDTTLSALGLTLPVPAENTAVTALNPTLAADPDGPFSATYPFGTTGITVTATATDGISADITSITGTASDGSTALGNPLTGGTAQTGSTALTGLTSGANTVEILLTANDGTITGTATYTITVTVETDPTLSALRLTPAPAESDPLDPAFDANTFAYTASFGATAATGGISITATAADTEADIVSITATGDTVIASDLASGGTDQTGFARLTGFATGNDYAITITVSPAIGEDVEYVITATILRSITSLLESLAVTDTRDSAGITLTQSGTTTTGFAALTNDYTASVTNSVTSVTIALTTDSDGTYAVTSSGAAPTNPAGPADTVVPLAADETTVTIVVTSEDGANERTYTIIFTRAPALASLALTGGGETVTIDDTTDTINDATARSFSVTLPSTATTATLGVTATDSTATIGNFAGEGTITFGGTSTGTGTIAGVTLAGIVDNEAFTFDITPAGGSAVTYTVTISHANMRLGTLTLTAPVPSENTAVTALNPTLADAPAGPFNATYPFGTTGITLTAAPSDGGADITTITATDAGSNTLTPSVTSGVLTTDGDTIIATVSGLTEGDNTVVITLTASDASTATYMITVTVAPPKPTEVVSFLENTDPIAEAGGTSTLTLTLDVPIPTGDDRLEFLYEIDGIDPADIVDADLDGDDDSLTGSIFMAVGSATAELVITGRDNGTDDDGPRTMTITLLDPLPSNADATPVKLRLASGFVPPQITITDRDASFEFVDQRNQRIEIGGDPGEITLQIRNFAFPTGAGAADTDVFVVGLSLGQGFDHNGDLVNHAFTTGSRIAMNGSQVQMGADLSIRLTNPASLDPYPTSSPTPQNLSESYQPYLITQSSNNFRVVLPRALFDDGEGTVTGIGNEDVTFQIVPGGRDGAVPQTFNVRVGSDTNGAVYDSIDGGSLSGRTRRTPPGEFRAGDNTGFPFTIVRASDAAQLPRMMNPAEQDVMIADTTLITVALPPGIIAPADAAMAVIRMTASSDDGTVTLSEENGRVGTADVTQLDFTLPERTTERSRNFRATVPAPVGIRLRDPEVVSIVCVNSGEPCTGTDANLKVAVSGGQRLSGDIGIHIEAQSGLDNDDDLTLTATSISFLDSGDNAIEDSTTTLSPAITGLSAKVNALTTGRTTVLEALTLGGKSARVSGNNVFQGNIVHLSALGTDTGAGNVSISLPSEALPLSINLGDDNDTSLVTGFAADGTTALGGIDTTAEPGDRLVTATSPTAFTGGVPLTGFTSGMNTLTILVEDTAVTTPEPDRTYTIRVFVGDAPPDEDDSSLESATVDGEDVDAFGGNLRTASAMIDPAPTTEIAFTPVNRNAAVRICDSSGDSLVSIIGPARLNQENLAVEAHVFTVYVTAASVTTPPTSCSLASSAANTTTYTLTVNVVRSKEARLADTTPLTLTLDPDVTSVEVPVGDITYTLDGEGDGTATASIYLPAGTDETDIAEIAIAVRDEDATASDIGVGTDPDSNLTVTSRRITAGINNDDTFTFTVEAEDTSVSIDYTITLVVQDASLANVSFDGTALTLRDTGSGGSLAGNARTVNDIAANATSGRLLLDLADDDDSLIMITGDNETRDPLTVPTVTGSGDRTIALEGLSGGTNVLMVTVRPANAVALNTDGNAATDVGDTLDRVYTISLVVDVSTRTGGMRANGSTNLPSSGEGAREATFDVFAMGFDVSDYTVTAGTIQSIQGVSFTLDFAGNDTDGAAVTSNAFSRDSAGVYSNDLYTVTFSSNTRHSLTYGISTAGEIQVNSIDTDFSSDGTIYIPVNVVLKSTIDEGAISIDGGINTLRRGSEPTEIHLALRRVFPGASETLEQGSITYNVLDAVRSSAAISPDGTTRIDEGAVQDFTVAVDPGFNTLASSGTATVTFEVNDGTSNARTVTVMPGTGETLSGVSVNQDGGSFTLDDGRGDAIIRIASIDGVISGDETITIMLTELEYGTPSTEANAGTITTNGGFPGADNTASMLTIVERTASTLATLQVDVDGTATDVSGFAADTLAYNIYVASGDATTALTLTTTDSATPLVCNSDGNPITLASGEYPVGDITGDPVVVKVHVTSESRVGGAHTVCINADADALTTTTYTLTIAPAPGTGTTTLGVANPPDVADAGGEATIPLVLSGFPEQVRVGTSLVPLTHVDVPFLTEDSGTNTFITPDGRSINRSFYSIRLPDDVTASMSGSGTAVIITLRVPLESRPGDTLGADKNLDITTIDNGGFRNNEPVTFEPGTTGYAYRVSGGGTAGADFPPTDMFTNPATDDVAFTIRAATAPRAEVSIAGTSTNIPEASDTGLVFNISLTGLATGGNAAAVVMPFRIDGSADGSATWSDATTTGDYTMTAGGGDGSGTTVGTFNTASSVTTGLITIPVSDQDTTAGTGVGSFAIVARDDGNNPSDAGETIVLEMTKATGVLPTDLTIGDPTTFNLRTVEQASVSITSTLSLTEGGSDGTLTVEVERGNLATSLPIVVNYAVASGGTAESGDYSLSPTGSISFAADADLGTGNTITVTANQDSDRDDEEFTVQITSVIFGLAADNHAPHLATNGEGLTGAASIVDITDNDAGAVLSVTDNEASEAGDPATFQVVISDAPAILTTINLDISGNATHGADPNDYTIGIAGGAITTALNVGDAGGDLVATTTPNASGDATVTFTVTAIDDTSPDETDNITVAFDTAGVTNAQSTDFAESGSGTISIEDNDVVAAGFCNRTDEVREIIVGLIANKECPANANGDVTEAELNDIPTLDLSGVTSATTNLARGDLEHLSGLTSLTLWSDLATIESGALDPVLSSLTTVGAPTGLMGLPPALEMSFAVDSGGDTDLPRGGSASFTVSRTAAHAYTAVSVTYTVTYGGTPTPVDADFTGETGTLEFAATDVSKTITVRDLSTAEPGGTVTITLGIPTLDADTRTPSTPSTTLVAALIEVPLATNNRELTVVLPTARPTLSSTAGSIGEKAGDDFVVTLNLGTGGDTDYGTAAVSFTLSNTSGDETADPGVPTLATSAGPPVVPEDGDYTLAVSPAQTGNLGNSNTVNLTAGVSSVSFTFTAIDDDRREGNEVVTLTVTGVIFGSANATDFPGSLAATVEITEISGEDIMRETQMVAHAVGKEQVNLITGLVRQRVSALTLGTPEGFSEPGVQLALAENPETIQDFFSQMALESSGEMDEGGAYAIWAKGQYIKISGSPDVVDMNNFEYDGKIAGIGMGMEKRFSESLVGLSMNFSTADIDSSSDVRTNANYKETMTFFAPYAAWKPNNSRLTLWGTAGAGFGSATVNADEHAEGNPSVQAFFAQGGVDISDNLGETAELVFGMSAVAIEKTVDAWTAGTDSAPEAESSIFQAQADFTAYFPVYSDDGQVLRPYVGLASVHDVGDVTNDDRHAMELQTGMAWSNGPWQVSFDTFYQFLRDDEEAWGIFGEAQWSGRGDLDGLLMGVTSGHGTASSMSDAASSTDSINSDIDTNLADADTETAEWSIQTNTEYGFAAPLLDRNGRATPFFRSTHSADARSFESGVRMDVTDNIGMTVETNRHMPADDDPYSEHAVGLEARWEF